MYKKQRKHRNRKRVEIEEGESEFMTYKQYKKLQSLNSSRRSRSQSRWKSGRNTKSFRGVFQTRSQKRRYRIWTEYEEEVKKEIELKNKELEETCPICYESSIELDELFCGHKFHQKCLLQWMKGMPGKGDLFKTSEARCPCCRVFMKSRNPKSFVPINNKIYEIRDKYNSLVNILLHADGVDEKHVKVLKNMKATNISTKEEILKEYMFYSCFNCSDLYFGGLRNCQEEEEEGENEDDKKKQRKCHKCRARESKHPEECKKHGKEFIVYKCRYCCSLANFFCFGTTHFCQRCHSTCNYKVFPCPAHDMKEKKKDCDVSCNGKHVKNAADESGEQCLGCGICRGLL